MLDEVVKLSITSVELLVGVNFGVVIVHVYYEKNNLCRRLLAKCYFPFAFYSVESTALPIRSWDLSKICQSPPQYTRPLPDSAMHWSVSSIRCGCWCYCARYSGEIHELCCVIGVSSSASLPLSLPKKKHRNRPQRQSQQQKYRQQVMWYPMYSKWSASNGGSVLANNNRSLCLWDAY